MTMKRFFFTRALAMLGIAALLVLGAVGAARAAPTLIVDQGTGKLLGADDVDVAGTLYDVRFVVATCAQAFGACTVDNFAFKTEADARVAAEALINQVFVGDFDTTAGLTVGCAGSNNCTVFTPFDLVGTDTLQVASVTNWSDEALDGPPWSPRSTEVLTENGFAVWSTSSAASVAEPTSVLLACSALGLMGLSSRRGRPCAERAQPLAG